MKFAPQMLLRCPVKVNDHIAAKDTLHLLGNAEIGVHKINPAKS